MDRTNVETVIVAGKVRKWKGKLLDVDSSRLRSQLEDSRDFHLHRGGRPAEPVPLRRPSYTRSGSGRSALRAGACTCYPPPKSREE
jgi:hypothetical protein